jgi:hypothetical protein
MEPGGICRMAVGSKAEHPGSRRPTRQRSLQQPDLTGIHGDVRRHQRRRGGPLRTEPSVVENALPQHGHTIRLFSILETVQPAWVHLALKALKSFAAGWAITICRSGW